MSADEFTRLFTYMEERFNRIDTLAKRQEIDEDERLVMRHQLERLDQWVHQLAEKIGVKLSA